MLRTNLIDYARTLKRTTHLFLCLIAFYHPITFAAKEAYIKSIKATIYADLALQAPLGFVRQGKKILVGEVSRRNESVYSLALAGKVAYIRANDITFDFDELSKEAHDVSRKGHKFYNTQSDEFEDNLRENNYLTFHFGPFGVSGDWTALSQEFNEAPKNGVYWELAYEHRPPYYRTGIAVGLAYYQIKQSGLEFAMPSLESSLSVALFKSSFFNLETQFGISLSGDVRIKATASGQNDKGVMWGYFGSMQLRFFPQAKFNLFARAAYRSLNFNGLEALPGTQTVLNKIVATELSAGLGYSF